MSEIPLHQRINEPAYVRWAAANAADIHLYMIHNARVKLVATQLPQADVIVDLGGAAAPIYEMGYPYNFQKLIVVDLPPDHRHEMYRGLELKDRDTPQGPIYTLLSSMTDLTGIPSNSADLVWAGQSIEHITREEAKLMYKEVIRILKREGHFCLDTPNRLLTAIHVAGPQWIHPEHKIEYYPSELKADLWSAGFTITDQLGVVEMINTRRAGSIDYRDFYIGSGVNTNLEGSYVQYYNCMVTERVALGEGALSAERSRET
jgi:SAM-dependent methyltransferase